MKRLSREINIFSMSALDLFASAMGAFILLTVILFPYYLKNSEIVEKMSALRGELEQTQAALAETEQKLQKCEAQRQQCESQRAQQQERIASLEQQLQQSQAQDSQQQEKIAGLEQQLQKCQAQKGHLQGQVNALQQDLNNCHDRLKTTFLAVVIEWSEEHQDIDLHVIDPDGQEFYFSKNNRNSSDFPSTRAELSVDTINGPGVEIWENPQAKQGAYKVYANLFSRRGNNNNPVVRSKIYYRDGFKALPNMTLRKEKTKKLIATIEVNAEGEVSVR